MIHSGGGLNILMHLVYLKYSGTPKRNMLGKLSPSQCCSANNRKMPKVFGASRINKYVLQLFYMKYSQECFRQSYPTAWY